MYRTIDDFVSDWEAESAFTMKVFSEIKEGSKSNRPTENSRSLERIAWHITHTLTEMPFRAGLMEADDLDQQPIPDKLEEILSTYQKYSTLLIELVAEKWTDHNLTEKIEIYEQQWERRSMLSVLIKHQIHHRGQMTALMRIQDLKVPGTYGPSKEEWEQYGMSPQE